MTRKQYPQANVGAHLLDTDADQNIGNSCELQPEPGVGGTIIPQTAASASFNRLLKLNGPSRVGQTTSIILTATRIPFGDNNPRPGYAGPVTAVIVFGNGGRATSVEVDVPIGPFVGTFQGAASSVISPQDGGVIVTVPTGMLEVHVRYDNRLIQPSLGLPVMPIALELAPPVPFVGPGGPVVPPAPPGNVAPAEPVLVKAMAAYYSRHFSKAYKTQYCYVSQIGQPPVGIPSGNVALYCVPAFAQTVQVKRYPNTADLLLETYDGVQPTPLDSYTIASGASPIVPLTGQEKIVRVSSVDVATDLVSFLALTYEIGI